MTTEGGPRAVPVEVQAGEGDEGQHGHGPDDHDHGPEVPLEENPIWLQDNVVLHSVGVDIGSSGTQVSFSRLLLRRMGDRLTSRYVVVERETHFQSEVVLTPFLDQELIDTARLGELLDAAYAEARVVPEDVDTGAVILTGEAVRRRNAEQIASVVAERAGELVCATAGHHMEAMLAAYGSGTVRRSHQEGSRLLNVDIGGGTTKLALVDAGRVVFTAALHVGGRLLAVDNGIVVRLEPGGARHAERAGRPVVLGDRVGPEGLDAVATRMAAQLELVLSGGEPDDTWLWLTPPPEDLGALDGLVFSGGVAEYVYEVEQRDFGDLGPRLGAALAGAAAAGRLPAPLLAADARIRATVLGASEYTVQLSGITSHLGSPDRTLPRRNLPVVHPDVTLSDTVDTVGVAAAIRGHVARYDLPVEAELALALRWEGMPEYPRLRAVAEALVAGLSARISAGTALYVVLDGDVARTLGRLLVEELGVKVDVVVLDGVRLQDFDHIDLGRVRQPSGTVPITIKSLLFGEGAQR